MSRPTGYHELWRWSVTELEAFWELDLGLLRRPGVARRTSACSTARAMPGAEWFPGARLNYAEHVVPRPRAATPSRSVTPPSCAPPRDDLGRARRGDARVRGRAPRAGVGPGDRVVGVPPEHRRGRRRVPRVREPRRGLVELLARLRRAERRRPVRADRAAHPARRRRLPLRRPRPRPARRRPRAPGGDADASSGRSSSATSTADPALGGAPRRDAAGTTSSARATTRRSRSRRSPSTIRSGCSTAPGRPGSRRRSSTGTAASSSSC